VAFHETGTTLLEFDLVVDPALMSLISSTPWKSLSRFRSLSVLPAVGQPRSIWGDLTATQGMQTTHPLLPLSASGNKLVMLDAALLPRKESRNHLRSVVVCRRGKVLDNHIPRPEVRDLINPLLCREPVISPYFGPLGGQHP
jgi:hypothetical protein